MNIKEYATSLTRSRRNRVEEISAKYSSAFIDKTMREISTFARNEARSGTVIIAVWKVD